MDETQLLTLANWDLQTCERDTLTDSLCKKKKHRARERDPAPPPKFRQCSAFFFSVQSRHFLHAGCVLLAGTELGCLPRRDVITMLTVILSAAASLAQVAAFTSRALRDDITLWLHLVPALKAVEADSVAASAKKPPHKKRHLTVSFSASPSVSHSPTLNLPAYFVGAVGLFSIPLRTLYFYPAGSDPGCRPSSSSFMFLFIGHVLLISVIRTSLYIPPWFYCPDTPEGMFHKSRGLMSHVHLEQKSRTWKVIGEKLCVWHTTIRFLHF